LVARLSSFSVSGFTPAGRVVGAARLFPCAEQSVKNREQSVRQLALRIFDITKRTWLQSQREKLKGGYDLSESEFLALEQRCDEKLVVSSINPNSRQGSKRAGRG